MFQLKTLVSRSASIAAKQQLTKAVPIAVLSNRNYADHQIPERLKDVATAKGMSYTYQLFLFSPANQPISQFTMHWFETLFRSTVLRYGRVFLPSRLSNRRGSLNPRN